MQLQNKGAKNRILLLLGNWNKPFSLLVIHVPWTWRAFQRWMSASQCLFILHGTAVTFNLEALYSRGCHFCFHPRESIED